MDFVTGRTGSRENTAPAVAGAPGRGYPHLLAAMNGQLPAVIIDTQPSEFREYAPYPIALFPGLAALIAENSHSVQVVDGFDVYLLSRR
jgi:hypothetical protein